MSQSDVYAILKRMNATSESAAVPSLAIKIELAIGKSCVCTSLNKLVKRGDVSRTQTNPPKYWVIR